MKTLAAPPTTRVDTITDTYHGQQITDPYRWLEDASSPETIAWVDAQNACTRSYLDAVPGRDDLQQRLTEILSMGLVTAPTARGNRYFHMRRDGDQNQPILYVREGIHGADRELVDPNAESVEGLVTLDWWSPSWDGSMLAFGLSRDGDEWSTLGVLNVETGERLPDRVERARFSSIAWLPDDSGFYYNRCPFPGEVPEGEENYHVHVFFHALGSRREDDPLVFGEGLDPEEMARAQISANGRWLLVSVHRGWERNDVYLRDLSVPDGQFQPLAVGDDALFGVEVVDDTLFIHTNLDAPHYRLFRAPAAHPAREQWHEIIPESPDAVLTVIAPADHRLLIEYTHNATSTLAVFNTDGEKLHDVALPALGTITGLSGHWDKSDAFFSFESFTIPTTVYQLSVSSGDTMVWAAVDASTIPDEYTVSQEWYTSRDGTRVSMFIVHRADLDRSRPQPTYLTGYGGFNVGMTPLFARSALIWIERGGIYAMPNLRGGSEYGEEWHRAGMLDRKQSVFDDFIGAAEHLIAQGYTEPSQLAISGRSNGGLLVGAALTQRPDLFRAVVCGVPLLDMLRYHHFLIARLWVAEYGSADNPEQFPFIHAYSPYHHVVQAERYPATLLFTAESDSRVDPLHARKMAALLQAANASDHPILLRVEQQAGHGAGKPLSKIIEEQTDVWSFVFWQVGMSC